ncbi:protein RIC-3 [Synchiropus splendidus]|uniref:protein RIC-3 n=1 Tax=Synchiropus splendidus TaxID=270530 RepID=UPI00237E40DC|nr:protein RIC-3 [Synchiropus splendidus]
MSLTTCQKVTLISCCVLCVSLFLPRMFLPRARKEVGQPQVGPGFYPPARQQQEEPDHWGVDPFTAIDTTARIKPIGRGKKSNLMAQVIPVYGFGILLYILYIIYKLTCRGKTKPGSYAMAPVNYVDRNTPVEYELARLQERLIRTEMMMDRIVAKKGRSSTSGRRKKGKTRTSKREEKLLRELRELTQLMQEGRLEGASPEMEAEEVPYGADWEGYPEETYPENDLTTNRYAPKMVTFEEITNQPTAEALAERMEQEEDEVVMRRLSVVQEEDEDEREEEEEEEEEVENTHAADEEEEQVDEYTEDEEEKVEEKHEEQVDECTEEEEEEAEAEKRLLMTCESSQQVPVGKPERLGLEVSRELQGGGKKHLTFSDHRDVFRYPREATFEEDEEEEEEEGGTEMDDAGDEDDPVMEAESLQFSCVCPNPEEEAEEEELVSGAEEEKHIQEQKPKEVTGLRMRSKREK